MFRSTKCYVDFGWAQILKLGWVTRSCGKINQTMQWVKTLSLISIYLVYPLLSKVEFVSENSYKIYIEYEYLKIWKYV